jgi:hypothetical protein
MIPFFITCVHFTYLKIHPRIALYTQELVWTVSGFVGVWVGGYTVRLLFYKYTLAPGKQVLTADCIL